MSSKFHRKEILFRPADVRLIERAAKRHGRKFGPFVKEAVIAYLKGMYLVPDTGQVHDLELALNRIGTNINQIAFVCNRERSVLTEHVAELQAQHAQLHEDVRAALTRPDNLNHLVREALRAHPRYREVLEQIIDQESSA